MEERKMKIKFIKNNQRKSLKTSFLTLTMTMFLAILLTPQVAKASNTTIAKIKDVEYTSLQDAVDAAENEKTPTIIKIVTDGFSNSGIMIRGSDPKNIIFDFDGKTVTLASPLIGNSGTETQNVHIEKGSKVVFKNGTLKASSDSKMMIQNYADLTLTDMNIDARESTSTRATYYVISNNNGSLLLNGKTNIYASEKAQKNFALDVYYNLNYPNGVNVTIDTTGTIFGDIEVAAKSGIDPTDVKSTLTIKNGNFQGNIAIMKGLENNVAILGGAFTDTDTVDALIPKEEQSMIQKIQIAENTYAYVKETKDNVIIETLVDKLEEKDMDVESVTMIKRLASSKKYTIVSFYEINLVKSILYNGNSYAVGQIKESVSPVEVTLDIPTTLGKEKSGTTRKYYVIRLHADKVTTLDAKDNGNGTITFDSDKFSSYALAYEDIESPDTHDGVMTSIIVGAIGFIGLIVVAFLFKQKVQRN